MHSHTDSKLLIMFFTPSKMQLSSPPFTLALQIRSLVLRAPHTTSPWLHKSASEPRETSELSGCNNSWWEPGFCCIIPPRDWAGRRMGQGWGSQGLLRSRSWEGRPLPRPSHQRRLRWHPIAGGGHGNVLWVGCVIWDLGGRDHAMWEGSTEVFGCACNTCSPAQDWSVSLFSWFVSPGFPSCSKSPLTSVCLCSTCSRPLSA